jgi:AcrR family transcriptional regulator
MFYTGDVAPSTPKSTPSNSATVPGRGADRTETPSAALPAPPGRISRRREPPARRTALTLEGIVAAALEVLDEAGVAGFSMRGVAERLGTGAASLYAHVSGKDELLELAYDELVGQVPLPEPDPDRWREQVHQMLGDFRQTFARSWLLTATPLWPASGECPHPRRP